MHTPLQALHELGQRIWLDAVSRELLDSGWLLRYIRELQVTGVTSNPTLLEQAVAGSPLYDGAIRALAARGLGGEALLYQLALLDLRRAADLLRPSFEASNQLDGWVSLELSPLLGEDSAASVRAAARLHAQAQRPNLFIKIPGTPEGAIAIEQCTAQGIPINVTLLFSAEQYEAAAHAYLRGLEWRLARGQHLRVDGVASLFVSRWDAAVNDQVPVALRNRLGLAVARQTYRSHHELLASSRWQRLAQAGARPQRLLWASMGSKDPTAPDTLYADALVAASTISTLPETTLLSFADHGRPGTVLAHDGGNAEAELQQFRDHGVNLHLLAARLQREGLDAFNKSWRKLLESLASKLGVPSAA
jgi:transaldolase